MKLQKKKRILVLYTGNRTGHRSSDFYSSNVQYETMELPLRKFSLCLFVIKLMLSMQYRGIIVSGWDNMAAWLFVLLSFKKKGCIIESSDYDSTAKGIKGWTKGFFLSRINCVFASGIAQERLARSLKYKGRIIKFGGCGLLRYHETPKFEPRTNICNFLFVGRLSEEKNIGLLIDVFNTLSKYRLTIIGSGQQEDFLKSKAKKNILFLGSISNANLYKYYSDADVFVLPSKREPWGLVVEEALNAGCPVIVSDKVGCGDDLVLSTGAGLVFKSGDRDDLKRCIEKISDIRIYNTLRLKASTINFQDRAYMQVESFLKFC